MRLYEVVESMGGNKAYKPTTETFPSTRAFAMKVKADGKAYAGKSWIILSEGKIIPQTMKVKAVEQFEIAMGE